MLTIGKAMRKCRRAKRISQKKLSDASGIEISSISRYEREITFPGILSLVALADALGVSLDEYVGRSHT